MPSAPKRPCSGSPTCPYWQGQCPVHRKAARQRADGRWASSGADRRKSIPPSVRAQVKPEGAICYVCRSRYATQIDHIVPLSQGGSSEIENLAPICVPCHRVKQNREISEGRRRAGW